MYTLINVGSQTSARYGHGVTSLSLDIILAALPTAMAHRCAGMSHIYLERFQTFKTPESMARGRYDCGERQESTFILAFDTAFDTALQAELYDLAVKLKQDCIACAEFEDDGSFIGGKLVGPHSEKWGNFDPAYFLDLMGKPVS